MAATSEQRSTVVGVFEDRHQADSAIGDAARPGSGRTRSRSRRTDPSAGPNPTAPL